jgi:cobalt-zinc-cadmium efflux system outer membrane protein
MAKRKRLIAGYGSLLVLGCGLWFGSVAARGQDPPEKPTGSRPAPGNEAIATLSEYLTQAALSNEELKAAFYRWKAALEKVPQVKSLPDPRFTFDYFIRSVETRTGPQQARFQLAQTFPWFGKLSLKGDMATQEASAVKAEYDALKLKIFFEVKNAYFEYGYLAKAVEITRENIELLRYLESVARARYSAGATPYADVIRTQVELEKLEDRLKTLVDLRMPIMAKLIAAMNMPVDSVLPWPEDVPVMVIGITDDELFQQLPEHNPRIKKFEYLEAKEQAGIELAQKDYYPDFTLGLQTIATGDAVIPGISDSGEDPIIASVSINLPVWWDKRRAAVSEAHSRRLSAKTGNQAVQDTLRADMQLALYKYRDARRKIDLYQNTLIPKAEQSLAVTLEAFQAGLRSSLDLIDAEKTLLEFGLAHVRALADQAQSFARLEMFLGKEIPCEIHGSVLPDLTFPRS